MLLGHGARGLELGAFWGTLASPAALGPPAASLGWEEAGVILRKRRGPRHSVSGPQELPRSAPACIRLWDSLNGPCKAQHLAGQSLGPLLGCTPGSHVGTAYTAGSDPGRPARPAGRGCRSRGGGRAGQAVHLKGRAGRAVCDSLAAAP